MIKRMILKNFQIHRKLILDFDEKLNIIQGANDSGKSSIIRALFWTFYNSPSGDWMRRIDKKGKMKTCIVKIIFSDGVVIKRIKGEKINRYSINEQNFDNFGYDVPDEVKRAIGIFPFKTLKEEFNPHVSMQDEKGFLIHESSTTRASVLDTLTGVSSLRKGIKSFNSEQQELKRNLLDLNQEKKELDDSLSRLANIDSIALKIKELEDKDKIISELKNRKEGLSKIKDRIQKFRLLLKNKEKVFNLEKSIKDYLASIILHNEKKKKLTCLCDIKVKLERNRRKIIKIPSVKELGLLILSIKDIINQISTLQGYRDSLVQKREKIEESDTEIVSMKRKLEDLKIEIGVCPLCEGVGKWTQ
jgi:DNA repair exonuclease SbcCD ATPase subunit